MMETGRKMVFQAQFPTDRNLLFGGAGDNEGLRVTVAL